MTEAQYLAWRDDAVFAYAQDRRRRGGVAADEARGGARREGDSLVLEGASSPGRHLLSTRDADGGERVGMVRLAAGGVAAGPFSRGAGSGRGGSDSRASAVPSWARTRAPAACTRRSSTAA